MNFLRSTCLLLTTICCSIIFLHGQNIGIGTASPIYKLDIVGDVNYTGDMLKNGTLVPVIVSLDDLSNAATTANGSLSLGKMGMLQGVSNLYINTFPTNSTGSYNNLIGAKTGRLISSGFNNNFLGYSAGDRNTSGSNNIFIGQNTGFQNQVGSNNTYIGSFSGYYNLGSDNVFIGFTAGQNNTNSSNKLIIANTTNSQPLIYGEFDTKRVFINRESPISAQEIFGITREVTGSSYGGMYVETKGSATSIPYYGFAIDGSSKAWIEYSGTTQDVGVFNANGNFKVNYNTASKPVAGSWVANSDSRLKKNIRSMDSAKMLEKIRMMRGVHYEWDDNMTKFERPEGEQIGFIAQDLQKIWPEKITSDDQGFLMTAYGDYDPVFVEAIKALADQLDQQSKEIEFLKREIERLKNKS